MNLFSNTGLPANRPDEPLAEILLRMRHHHDARQIWMREDMVRTVDSRQPPTRAPELAYQIGAGHVCMIHTYATRP